MHTDSADPSAEPASALPFETCPSEYAPDDDTPIAVDLGAAPANALADAFDARGDAVADTEPSPPSEAPDADGSGVVAVGTCRNEGEARSFVMLVVGPSETLLDPDTACALAVGLMQCVARVDLENGETHATRARWDAAASVAAAEPM